MRITTSRVTRVALQSKHWLVAMVGGLLPPHETTNDASSTTRQPSPPVCSRKCKHRWQINMNAKLSLHFRAEWYSLLLHISHMHRFFREVQQGLPRLSIIIKAHPEWNCTTTVTHCCRNSEETNKPSEMTLQYVKKSKMHESQLASYDKLAAVWGINPRPSSYLALYTIPN